MPAISLTVPRSEMKIGALLLFVLAAATKYMMAPPIGLAAGLNFWETFLVMLAGGLIGAFAFFRLGTFFIERARVRMVRRRGEALEDGRPIPRIFTKKNRKIIQWKHKLGFYGMVFTAIPLASIPIGAIIVAKFYRHEKLVIPMIISSVTAWGFALTAFYYFFYEGIKAYFL